jgi:alkylhydroperoxidase family enzyme
MINLTQHQNTENFMEALVRDHKRYRPIIEILDNIVNSAKKLTWLDFEEIAVTISNANQSGFCSEIHRATKDALKNYSIIELNKNIDVIIAFSLKLNANPKNITAIDLQILKDKGWDDQSIEDVIGWVATIKLYNIMANGFGFSNELPSEVFDEMGNGTVKQAGFLPIFDFFASQNK